MIFNNQQTLSIKAVALLICIASSLLAGTTDAQTDEPLTSEQRKHLRSLVSDFKRSKTDAETRSAVFNEAVEFGAAGVKALEPAIEKKIASALKSYLNLFRKATTSLAKEKQIDGDTVARLRAGVLALREDPALSKTRILNQGDPAMAELRELLLIPLASVLEDERVATAREGLVQLGSFSDRLQQKKLALSEDPTAPLGPVFSKRLNDQEELMVQLAMPMPARDRAVMIANREIAGQIEPEEANCIAECNEIRSLLGLSVLQIDVKMGLAARDHSKDMSTRGFFSHDSPIPGKAKPWDRAKNFGTTANAENIYVGKRTGEAANLAWWRSPGHHKNMLHPTRTRIGVGQYERHWTELLGN